MKKISLSFLFITFLAGFVFAQTITPVPSDPVCPGIVYTFAVSIPGKLPSVIGSTGSPMIVKPAYNFKTNLSGTLTTFNFQGQFQDVNDIQAFRVNFSFSDNTLTSVDFNYVKIKSLTIPLSSSIINPNPSIIYPNPTTVKVPICQVTSFAIIFNAVNYTMPFENPPAIFGTVSNYEYQLPANWSIGPNISTGTNWIPGSNNVTVTSDLSTGNGFVIRIRPVNTACAPGLRTGPEAYVAVSRPGPTLSISAVNNNAICIGNTATYSMTGMSPGSTVVWQLESTTNASIQGPNTNPTVIVKNNSGGNTFVNLKASVTDCAATYIVTPKKIILGPAKAEYISLSNGPCPEYTISTSSDFVNGGPPSNYTWMFRNLTNNSPMETFPNSSYGRRLILDQGSGTYYFGVQIQNNCGTGQIFSITKSITCNFTPRLTLSPNPSSESLTIETSDQSSFTQLKIIDKTGVVRKLAKYSPTQKTTLNISDLPIDIYRVQVLINNEWRTATFIKR